jgi:hypothetical protein
MLADIMDKMVALAAAVALLRAQVHLLVALVLQVKVLLVVLAVQIALRGVRAVAAAGLVE